MTKYFTSPEPFRQLLQAAQDFREAYPEAIRPNLEVAICVATDAVKETEEYASVIEKARSQATDDLEIDDHPLVSPSDHGCWVAAWVHIRDNPDEGYNGWTNYETWNVALWIGNDQGLQETAKDAGTYKAFVAFMRETGEECDLGAISRETPDGIAWNDSGLDHDELDKMIAEIGI